MSAKQETFSVPTNAQGDDWQAATGSSSAVNVHHLTNVRIGLAGTFVATVYVDVSFDGVNFVPWEASTVPGNYYAIPDAAVAFKMRTSAYTSGTPTAGGAGMVGYAGRLQPF